MATKKKTSEGAPEDLEIPKEENKEETVKPEEKKEPEARKEEVPTAADPEPPLPVVETSVEGAIVNARVYPQIRVGVCEFHGTPHGVVDPDTIKGKCWHVCKSDPFCPHSREGCEKNFRPGEEYCRHEHNYKGLKVRCTYCPIDTDMRGVIKSRTLYVFQNPQDPTKIVMVCSDLRCRDKHLKRFTHSIIG